MTTVTGPTTSATAEPKPIKELSAAEQYRIAIANEIVNSPQVDPWAAHTNVTRAVDLGEAADTDVLKETADAFFNPRSSLDERVKTAKALLREKAQEFGYSDATRLRVALGSALEETYKPLEVAPLLQGMPLQEAIELAVAASVVMSHDKKQEFQATHVAQLLAKHLAMTGSLGNIDELEAALGTVHAQTYAGIKDGQDAHDAALDVLADKVPAFKALDGHELARAIAPPRPRESGGMPPGMEKLLKARKAAEGGTLEERARFKQLSLNQQYNAILGTVVLRSFGDSNQTVHERAEAIFDLLHPHRGESQDVRRARVVAANRTFLAPGQGQTNSEKQILVSMQRLATACGAENAEKLMELVAAMAGKPARLDVELFNTEIAARMEALASAIALTQPGGMSVTARKARQSQVEAYAAQMMEEMGGMMVFSPGGEEDLPPAAPSAADVAARLGERLAKLGLPRDEALEKAAVEKLFAAGDPAEAVRLAREQLRGWTRVNGLRFSKDVVESLADHAAPQVGPDPKKEEASGPMAMMAAMMGRQGRAEKVDKKTFSEERPSRPIADILAEIETYAGWDQAKKYVEDAMKIIDFDMMNKEVDAEAESRFQLQHLLLKGPPGTGKTTFAKLWAELLHACGLLPANMVTRAKATDLVSRYLGGSSHDTQKILDAALGGVLFIDEIYRLARVREYGQEAIDTINEFLDEHRNEFVCVVTGYTEETNEFLARNPGLKDRFGDSLFFPAFSMAGMEEVVRREAGSKITIDEAAWPAIRDAFSALNFEAEDFSSGRTARKMYEQWLKNSTVRASDEAKAIKKAGGTLTRELMNTVMKADIHNTGEVATPRLVPGFIQPGDYERFEKRRREEAAAQATGGSTEATK